MPAYAAFLRAINLGAKRRVPMRELLPLIESFGVTEARAYLQSGNVVFRSAVSGKALEAKLEAAIAKKYGFEVPVTLRTAAEMQSIVEHSPHASVHPHERLQVAFLKDAPKITAEPLLLKAAKDDKLHLTGRELYLYLPGGVGESKLTNVFLDKQLGTITTLRNWKTVLAVAEMMRV